MKEQEGHGEPEIHLNLDTGKRITL